MMKIMLSYTLKDMKNANGWLVYSIATTIIIETLDADIDSLQNLSIINNNYAM